MASKRSIISTNVPKGVWPFTESQIVYEPVAIAIVAVAVFCIGVALGEPWIIVPLGATIVTAAQMPASDEAAFSHSVLGNLIAILVAFVIVDALGLPRHGVSVLITAYSPLRALGVLAALFLTPLIGLALKITQPAAAATAAFVVFGGIAPTPHAALSLVIGIVVVAALGDTMRRLRVRGAPVP